MIHFLHIGKTGGTALKHALEKTARRQVTVHPHQVKLPNIPAGEQVFFFLRDPISRFVSGFISRQRQGRPRYSVPWNESETAAFTRFATPNALAEALSADDRAERIAAEEAMAGIGHVRDSYWDWFISPEYLRSRRGDILFIGQQEHLGDDARVLSSLLKCGRLVLPDDDVAAHRNPEKADKSLSERAVANLLQRLAPEFDAIRLCAEIAREKGFGGSLAQ